MPQTFPLDALTAKFLEQLQGRVPPDCFQSWLKNLKAHSDEQHAVVVSVPSLYTKNWLERYYKNELESAARRVVPEMSGFSLAVASQTKALASVSVGKVLKEIAPSAASRSGGADEPFSAPAPWMHGRAAALCSQRSSLSPKFRLQKFVMGKCNRLAHASAVSVSESPAVVNNPLFVYGPHGLGKTHLLQGIAQEIAELDPARRVIYLSCEEFTNSYISALQSKRIDAFRAWLRSCDALLIDDVQFLAQRMKTQEELLHTFNTLQNANKQMVFSADAAPRDLQHLNPRLQARLGSGLEACLLPPDQEMRIGLLREIARERGCTLALDVIETLASHIEKSVRELESAVSKLIALAAAESRAPDRDLAIQALREAGYLRSGPLEMSDIMAVVVKHFAVSADEVRSEKRVASLVHARHMGMHLTRLLTSHSAAEIGRFYGNRDHATVLHACRKLGEELKRNENVNQEVRVLRQLLGR